MISADRSTLYKRLTARNRVVSVLRWIVPALGLVVLALLGVQIIISNMAAGFNIGQITMTGDGVVVETPQYAGTLSDGSVYRVSAERAQAALTAPQILNLTNAALSVTKSDGMQINASAPNAALDTNTETVTIDGIAYIDDTTGTTGILEDSVFNSRTQHLRANGPVDIAYADGTMLTAAGMDYDAGNSVWTFRRVTVTLPQTPGSTPAGAPQ